MLGNEFSYNMANQGGSIYLESDATLSSTFDTYLKNSAYLYGGAIFSTTRTIFTIVNGKFMNNYGDSDSAISAYMTSTIVPFHITSCLFSNNSGNSNTISLKNSYGVIKSCQFENNSASVYSGNIFLSFSNINISLTSFEDVQLGDPYTLLKTTEIQGQFLFISLGVVLYVQSCTFLNGIASQGGAIYLNGLSSLYITNSVINNNFAE